MAPILKPLVRFLALLFISLGFSHQAIAFDWNSANLYLVLPDRFLNSNPSNDSVPNRDNTAPPYRGFLGGDLQGITQKLQEGYFTRLGVNVLWLTPIQEQILGSKDEGNGETYAYHGYWIRDWTRIDPSFGTSEDLKTLVDTAHSLGIRVLLDAVLNHTGHITPKDPAFPEGSWVRTYPLCSFDSYPNTAECSLVGLPDILTESPTEVDVPNHLLEKWTKEGRADTELSSLNTFFEKTGLPRTPSNYLIKWLSDYVRTYGIDGFRVDTVKHTNPEVWPTLKKICQEALEDYRQTHGISSSAPFFLLGEVYGFEPKPFHRGPTPLGLTHPNQFYAFSDRKINYFDYGFDALINFQFVRQIHQPYNTLFEICNKWIQNDFRGKALVNYARSHDEQLHKTLKNQDPFETATKLLLSPGLSQIYYGEETRRPLLQEPVGEGQTHNDINLRGPMDWEDQTPHLLTHYQKLGTFRLQNPAVGSGEHQTLSQTPFLLFRRSTPSNQVLVALETPSGPKTIPTYGTFPIGSVLYDHYSQQTAQVEAPPQTHSFQGDSPSNPFGVVHIDSPYSLVLLSLFKQSPGSPSFERDPENPTTHPLKKD